jgi:hypothetical protein
LEGQTLNGVAQPGLLLAGCSPTIWMRIATV